MNDFETLECANCGASFKTLQGSNAAVGGYCSPRCEVEAKGF